MSKTVMNKLLLSVLLLGLSKGECLSDDALKMIGLAPTFPSNSTASKQCSTLYRSVKPCVNVPNLDAFISNKTSESRELLYSVLGFMNTTFASTMETLSEYCQEVVELPVGTLFHSVVLNEERIEGCRVLMSKEQPKLIDAKSKIVSDCLSQASAYIQSSVCVLASTQASEITQIQGLNLTLSVQNTSAIKLFDACAPLIAPACNFYRSSSHLFKLRFDFDTSISNARFCQAQTCTEDPLNCPDESKLQIFSELFSPLASKFALLTPLQIFLQNNTIQTSFEVQAKGFDLESGVTENNSVFFLSFTFALVAFFFLFL